MGPLQHRQRKQTVLRENIFAFLDEMKLAVLDDPGTGVMSPEYQIEDQLKNSPGSVRKKSIVPQAKPVDSKNN